MSYDTGILYSELKANINMTGESLYRSFEKNSECVCVEALCCTKVSDLYNTFEEKMRSFDDSCRI